MVKDGGDQFWKLVNAYEIGDKEELDRLINVSTDSTVTDAGIHLGISLIEWQENYRKKKASRKKSQHSKEWYQKKIKQAKGKFAKDVWRKAEKEGWNATKIRDELIKPEIKSLVKTRKNLKRHLKRLDPVGYKPRLKSIPTKFKSKQAKLVGYKKEVKYLQKLLPLARFATISKSPAGRYPKGWKYQINLKKSESEKAGLGKTHKLSVPRSQFGYLGKVPKALAKAITSRKISKGKKKK